MRTGRFSPAASERWRNWILKIVSTPIDSNRVSAASASLDDIKVRGTVAVARGCKSRIRSFPDFSLLTYTDRRIASPSGGKTDVRVARDSQSRMWDPRRRQIPVESRNRRLPGKQWLRRGL